jgi:hypothetical protein
MCCLLSSFLSILLQVQEEKVPIFDPELSG